MRRVLPEICGVECGSREKSGRKFDVFATPILGEALEIFVGICKSTPLPTYWPSLVEIPWLVFHLC